MGEAANNYSAANLNLELWLKHEIQMMTKHLVFFFRCTRKLTWWTASKPLTEAGRCPPSNYILHWPQNSSNVSPQDCFTDANSHCKYRLIIKRHVILLYIVHFIYVQHQWKYAQCCLIIHLHNFPYFFILLQENSLRDLNDVDDIHQKLDTSSTTADLPPPVKLPRTQSSVS